MVLFHHYDKWNDYNIGLGDYLIWSIMIMVISHAKSPDFKIVVGETNR